MLPELIQCHIPGDATMAELASVRAEIKAWERSFKEFNGRAATVEDVRQNSAIGSSDLNLQWIRLPNLH